MAAKTAGWARNGARAAHATEACGGVVCDDGGLGRGVGVGVLAGLEEESGGA